MNVYILDGHTPVPADIATWSRRFETSNRHVAQDERDGVHIGNYIHNYLTE